MSKVLAIEVSGVTPSQPLQALSVTPRELNADAACRSYTPFHCEQSFAVRKLHQSAPVVG
jgi:hypothetical protein